MTRILAYKFVSVNNKILIQLNLENDGKKEMSEAYTDKQIEETIDQVLSLMDKDNDGFISYSEYISSGVYDENKT